MNATKAILRKRDERTGVQRTRSRFCVSEEILPKIVVVLFLGELDGLGRALSRDITLVPWDTHLLNVTDTLDDQRQCLLVVAHPTKKEDHLWNQVTTPADTICL